MRLSLKEGKTLNHIHIFVFVFTYLAFDYGNTIVPLFEDGRMLPDEAALLKNSSCGCSRAPGGSPRCLWLSWSPEAVWSIELCASLPSA